MIIKMLGLSDCAVAAQVHKHASNRKRRHGMARILGDVGMGWPAENPARCRQFAVRTLKN